MSITNSTQLASAQAPCITRRVFFEGTGALRKGQGLCFNRDYGTAASVVQDRMARVELPTASNCNAFAGVTVQSYPANSGGQTVEIALPGSVVPVAVGQISSTTVNVTRMTCSCGSGDPGMFGLAGFSGRGSAIALQTVSTAVKRVLLTGAATLDAAGTTLTDGAATFVTSEVAAGDKVFICGGATSATAAAAVTAGEYTVSSVTSETVLVLTTAACSAASNVTYYVVDGSAPKTVLAYLEDGPESGLQEIVTCVSGGTTAPAAYGVTHIAGGYTVSADATPTAPTSGLPDGSPKKFYCLGTLTTQDYLVTVTGEQLDGTTDLNTLEFDAVNDMSYLIYTCGKWRLIQNSGPSIA